MIDFALISRSTDRYNFHSHTQFCDGRNTMAEFAAAAAAAGMEHYGFTPQSPIPVESPCNMPAIQVPEYLAEVARLRSLYAGRLNLYAGMEVDYLGDDWGPAHPYFAGLGLDYTIGSVHFLPGNDGMVDIDGNPQSFARKLDAHFGGDLRHVVELYYSRIEDMVRAGGFDILGHYDKVGLNASACCPGIEDERWYVDLTDRVTGAIIDSGVAVEINTKAFHQAGRFSPDRRHWKRLADAGVTILVNSDAHFTELIDVHRAEALDILRSIRNS